MRSVRFPTLSLRSVVTVLAVALALGPGLGADPQLRPAASGGNPSAERERVRAQQAQVATQVDALQATDAQV